MKSMGVYAVLLWTAGLAAAAGGMEPGGTPEPAAFHAKAANCDNFASARTITGAQGSGTFSNVGYGKEKGEPVHSSDGYEGGASAWAKWTAPGTGDWTFRLSGVEAYEQASLDTQLAIYTGQSLGTLSVVAANDDLPRSYSSRVSFRATKGQVYRIAMDTYLGTEGTMTLEWNQGKVETAEFRQYGQFMPREGGALAVAVWSTTNWVVSDASGWITVTTRSGKDGTAMACRVGANGTGENRDGTVTVSPSVTGGETEDGTLYVYQSCLSFCTNKAAAVARAKAAGKRLLLISGREACPNTFATLMDDLPSADVRARLEAGYVLWYANCDRQGEDTWDYLSDLGSYALPLLCVIPATNTATYLKRTTGYQGAEKLAEMLGNVVVFDGNGGTATEKVRYLEPGAALGGLPVGERKGFALAGWWTAREGGVQAKTSTVPDGGATVYYAHWNDLRQKVVFKGNGGTSAAETGAYPTGEPYGNLPGATKEGYAFLGWFTQVSGGTRVTAQSIVTGDKNRTLYAHWELAEEPLQVWRFYSEKTKGHFFTIGEAEKTQLLTTSLTWTFQGGAYRAYKARAEGTVPLYRFYSEKYKGHFFTRSEAEKDSLIATSKTWKYQGIAFYVYPNAVDDTIPVYRFWSDAYGHHFYTANDAEKDNLVATSKTWKYQGIAFWAVPLNTAAVTFDAAGGTCGMVSRAYPPGKAYGVLPWASWDGHAFLGWFTEASGGTRVTAQSIVQGAQPRTLYAHWEMAQEPLKVWRFYSEKNKGHFFTISEAEKTQLMTTSPTWTFQGGAYRAYKTRVAGTVPLYRFYSERYKGHFFTRSEAEKDSLVATSKNWKFQGIAYYVYPAAASGRIPVYRFWSDSYGHHFYTANEAEKNNLVATSKTWKYQGIAFWALPTSATRGAGNRAVRAEAKGRVPGGEQSAATERAAGVPSGLEGTSRLAGKRPDVEVTTSDGTDGRAAADGDEGTAWVPERPEAGSWLVLTFDEPLEVAEVTVVGENLPEGTRVLLSEDAETWFEGEGGTAQYVWVAFPPVAEGLKVSEVRVTGEGI